MRSIEVEQQQQHPGLKSELEVPPRYESHGYDPLNGRHRAGTAGWVDERGGYVCPQSQIVEAYGGGISEMAENLQGVVWPLHEMEDPSGLHEMEDPSGLDDVEEPSILLTKPLPPVPRQVRGSPELHDPINSEPNRESLHQKLRGKPAPHHHRSSANPCRNDWTPPGLSDDANSSSWRHSMQYGCLQSVPNGGDKTPNSNACTIQEGTSAPYQACAHPMSHEVSPEDPAPTTNYPLTNAVFPSSPNAALASRPSDMMSPVSPMFEDVHPPLTVASSTRLSHHGSSPRTLEHQEEENADGQTPVSSSSLQSTLQEPNNAFLLFDSLDSDTQSLLPLYDGIESTMPLASQTANSNSQPSLLVAQNRYQSEAMGVPSFSTQPHHLGMHPSNLEAFIQSNGSENVSEESGATQVHTPRSGSSGFSSIALSSTSPPQSRRTQLDSQCAINVQLPPGHTQSSIAFRIPPFFGSLNRQTGIVTGSGMEMACFGNSATDTQNWEQSDAGQSFCFPELQPWSVLDHLIATNLFDLHSSRPQWYSNDHCPQAVLQHHSHDLGTSQAPFVKWRPYCFDHNSSLVKRLKSKQEQVDDHLGFIHAFNNEWMQRIKELQPELWLLCSTLSASHLFDRAVRTWKSFICDGLVEHFEDVFAIVHLAFSAALIGTWQLGDYSFSALRDDALQWQHVLSSDEDKTRFLNAMDCWRLDKLEPLPLFASACGTDLGSTLWDRLKKGEVSKALIAFVDSKFIRS